MVSDIGEEAAGDRKNARLREKTGATSARELNVQVKRPRATEKNAIVREKETFTSAVDSWPEGKKP